MVYVSPMYTRVVSAILLLGIVPELVLAQTKSEQEKIPVDVPMMPVSMGRDTVGSAERAIGKGLVITGAHPDGARLWKLRRNEGYILADGFDYRTRKKRGEKSLMIATLTIRSDNPHPKERHDVPVIAHEFPIRWKKSPICLGMTYAKVIAILGQQTKDVDGKSNIVIQGSGFVRVNRSTTYTRWTTTFYFANNRLDAIVMDCE